MSSLEVEYKVSLNPVKNDLARWTINKDKGTITFYLSKIWEEYINLWEIDNVKNQDYCIDDFIKELIYQEIVERVCLERAHEKIRMKGRTRCKPNCCVRRVAQMMHDPDWFLKHRHLYPVDKPDYMDRGVDSSTFAKIG